MEDASANSTPQAAPVRLGIVTGPGTMRNVGQVLRRLVIGVLDELVEVTLLAPETEDVSALPDPPVKILRYPLGRRGSLRRRTIDGLAERLSERNIEILHAADSSAHALTHKLSDLGKWPYLVSAFAVHQANLLTPLGEHCRGVLAAAAPIRADLLDCRLADESMVRIVRPGVYHDRAAPQAPPQARHRAILVVGQWDDGGPYAIALEALAEIRRSAYECVFFLVGAGRAEHRLRQKARSLDLVHHLTFVSHLAPQQLNDVLRAADVFVYPHATGMLEMAVLEAMAAGVPVLTGSPCVGDFVIDGRTTLGYQRGEWADLALKLKLILDDPASAARMVEAALAYLREHHSPASMVSTMAALYREHAVRGRTLKLR